MDYYKVLGITEDASYEDIRKARNKMALKWHPDRHMDNVEIATEKMKQINEAFEYVTINKAKQTMKKAVYKFKQSKKSQTNLDSFETNVKMAFSNSKVFMPNNKKTHKQIKSFETFASIIIDLNNMFNILPADSCKSKIKILLDEMNLLIKDKNNALWFKQFRDNKGIGLFYEVYLNSDYFEKQGNLQILWQKILKYGYGYKY